MIPQAVRDLVQLYHDDRRISDANVPENFKLYATDNGGYDSCSEITLEFVGEQVFLIFREDFNETNEYNGIEKARFELRFV